MRHTLFVLRARALSFGAALAIGCGSCSGSLEVVYDTPESVLHDVVDDVYLVSNIHGAPSAKDGVGSIMRVAPDGTAQRAWIRGGTGGVTLHAPKGMALAGDVLWVADIDVVRKFDRRTGRPLGEVPIPGATFLNDVAVGEGGTVFVSDSGLDANFGPSGTDAIWRIPPGGEPEVLAKGQELGQPNGIVAHAGSVYVVSWRDGTFYQLDASGRRLDLAKAGHTQLDGLVRVAPGGGASPFWLATSWQGSCLYRFDLGGTATALPVQLEQPADMTLDERRGRLVVPLFGANRLAFVEL